MGPPLEGPQEDLQVILNWLDKEVPEKIILGFNQPMVSDIDLANSKGYQPFEIYPRVQGKVKWLSPAIVSFHPEEPFSFATQYSVVVPEESESIFGKILKKDFLWSFSTPTPSVTEVSSQGHQMTLQFNQEVPLEEVQVYVKLKKNNTLLEPVRVAYQDQILKTAVLVELDPALEGERIEVFVSHKLHGSQGWEPLGRDQRYSLVLGGISEKHPENNEEGSSYASLSDMGAPILPEFHTAREERADGSYYHKNEVFELKLDVPEFLRPTDLSQIRVVLHNGSDRKIQGVLKLNTTGLELLGLGQEQLVLEPKKNEERVFPIKVLRTFADVTVEFESQEVSEKRYSEIPIFAEPVNEKTISVGMANPNALEYLSPEDNEVDLHILISPTILSWVSHEAQLFFETKPLNLEQEISQLYGEFLLDGVLKHIRHEKKISPLAIRDQPIPEGNRFWIVELLTLLQSEGIEDKRLEGVVQDLRESLLTETNRAVEMMAALRALADHGEDVYPQLQYFFKNWSSLSYAAKVDLLLLSEDLGMQVAQAEHIQDILEGIRVEGEGLKLDVKESSWMATPRRVGASLMSLFLQWNPEQEIIPKLAKWLVAETNPRLNFYETFHVLQAFQEFNRHEKLQPFRSRVQRGGEVWMESKFNAEGGVIFSKKLGAHEIKDKEPWAFYREGDGKLYYKIYATKPDPIRPTQNLGLERRLSRDKENIWRLENWLVALEDAQDVVIEDLFPAEMQELKGTARDTEFLDGAKITSMPDRRILYFDHLPKGVYPWTVFLKGARPGSYQVPSSKAYPVYEASVAETSSSRIQFQ